MGISYRIKGGRALSGTVRISGAKNSVLKLMAASILGTGEYVIHNVPDIADVHTMIGVLRGLGARVVLSPNHELRIKIPEELSDEPPAVYVRKMRASIQVMGPLLARLGRVRISRPGGCVIGERPIDLHLNGFGEMGARIAQEHGYVTAEGDILRGAEIHLDYPSVEATEILMMAAALIPGKTIIHNCAQEPEIAESQRFINMMGGDIRGAGTSKITVKGVKRLTGIEYTVVPDRIEAGTYAVAAAMTGGDVTLLDICPQHLKVVTKKLEEAGCEIEQGDDWMRVRGSERPAAVHCQCLPYPGFPTDMQPQLMALMTVAAGTSVITEKVHSARFKHVPELRRMGASITVEGSTAIVDGVDSLTGAEVEATDLRAGAALMIAGLRAEGLTLIDKGEHIDRGYEDMESKLCCLGAEISRVVCEEDAVDSAVV